MELTAIRKLVADDSLIDDAVLDMESLKIPQLHNKYLNIFHDEKLMLCRLESEHKTMLRVRWEYYSGKMSKENLDDWGWQPFDLKILRQDLAIYIDSDEHLVKLKNKINYQKEKIDYLESVLKSLNNRNWIIRNAIEWRKFINGQ
jgi:antirestriction protein